MAANQAPIYTLAPKRASNTWLPATTANTKSDGTGTVGTDILLIATAGTNGSFLNKIILTPTASAAPTSTTGTVGRVYVSTVTSGATTNANTHLVAEVAAPAQSADQTAAAISPIIIPLGFAIAASDTVLFSMHAAAAANTSWHITLFYGDY